MTEILAGEVVIGDGRGQALGFPTANLQLEEGIDRPDHGVYAGWAQAEGTIYMAAIHVGPIPTYGITAPTVEVHLLHFPGHELYGEVVSVQFVEKLRDITDFSGSTTRLQEALTADVQAVEQLLAASVPPRSVE